MDGYWCCLSSHYGLSNHWLAGCLNFSVRKEGGREGGREGGSKTYCANFSLLAHRGAFDYCLDGRESSKRKATFNTGYVPPSLFSSLPPSSSTNPPPFLSARHAVVPASSSAPGT